MKTLTKEMVEHYLFSTVGLSGRSPKEEVVEATVSVLCPNDKERWARSYLYGYKDTKGWHIPSCCSMAVMAYMRTMVFPSFEVEGDDVPAGVREPYEKHVGRATSIVEECGRKLGLWLNDAERLLQTAHNGIFELGDVVRIGSGGAEHDFVVTGVRCQTPPVPPHGFDSDGTVVCSVDGGQVDGSWILERERLIVYTERTAYLVDPAKPFRQDGSPNGRALTAAIIGLVLWLTPATSCHAGTPALRG